jgi:hypothetical protein
MPRQLSRDSEVDMRRRALIAIALLALPVELSAQRVRMPGVFRRPRPAELPPQPGSVAREMSYKRLNVSVESYPMVSHIEASGFAGPGMASSWTSFGSGTRADYRLTPHLSATLDLTSSFLGGPAVMETAELGARLRPRRSDRRLYPFADVRGGYVYSSHSYYTPLGAFTPTGDDALAYRSRYGQGFGAVAGTGVEYSLTRTLWLTSSASWMRTRMTAFGFSPGTQPTSNRYWMTSYRWTVGVRYNPIRYFTQTQP